MNILAVAVLLTLLAIAYSKGKFLFLFAVGSWRIHMLSINVIRYETMLLDLFSRIGVCRLQTTSMLQVLK